MVKAMTDYGKAYRGVQYFGIWADETADSFGTRDAVNILADAVGLCFDQDMRQRREILSALHYLSTHGGQEKAARRFRSALDLTDPATRFRAASDAVKALQAAGGRAAEVSDHTRPAGPPALSDALDATLRALDGRWLEVRCSGCGSLTQYPLRLMAQRIGSARRLGEILPRLVCKRPDCRARPATVYLCETHNRQPNHGAPPGWSLPLPLD